MDVVVRWKVLCVRGVYEHINCSGAEHVAVLDVLLQVTWKHAEFGFDSTGEYDTVLLAVGRDACTRDLGLEEAGVKYDAKSGGCWLRLAIGLWVMVMAMNNNIIIINLIIITITVDDCLAQGRSSVCLHVSSSLRIPAWEDADSHLVPPCTMSEVYSGVNGFRACCCTGATVKVSIHADHPGLTRCISLCSQARSPLRMSRPMCPTSMPLVTCLRAARS